MSNILTPGFPIKYSTACKAPNNLDQYLIGNPNPGQSPNQKPPQGYRFFEACENDPTFCPSDDGDTKTPSI